MTDQHEVRSDEPAEDAVAVERREFLRSLGKWSQAVISGVLGAGLISSPQAQAGSWVNRRGGGSWINGGGWNNRPGSWINRGGSSWINGGGWNTRPSSWINGGGSWINRRGGGSVGWDDR